MPHPRNPVYFKETIPGDWSVKDYVKFQVEHSEKKTSRQISDGWHRSLRAIADCKDDCCTQDEIDQANVHYGRWKNKKTADRKYLSQWLAEQEAKKKAKSTNSFHIGSVGTLFAGPVNSVYSNGAEASSAPAAATVSSGNVPEGLQAVTPAAAEEEISAAIVVPKDDIDFQYLLSSFKSTYDQMKTKTLISPGKYLETEVYNTVIEKVAGGFKEMNQLFLWVINPDDAIIVDWFPELLEWIKEMIMPMPAVRSSVIYAISGFSGLSTADEYHEYTYKTYIEFKKSYDKGNKPFDATWTHNAMRHLISLVCDTNGLLLSDELLEGSLECTLWANLVDLLLVNVFVARRRDSSLMAFKSRPDILQGTDPHFDAVICNHVRTRTTTSSQLRAPDEWGLIEVARKNDGPDSPKWKKDNLKMLRGLCALMRYVGEYVDYDEETLKKLQFPGLIQAGLETMTIRLTCVGRVFIKQEGSLRKVPTSVETLPQAFELLESLWLFKKMMVDCREAVQNYTERKGKGLKPVAPASPNTYYRERLHKPGSL
ncbi:hypothetical protein DFP73DRAFT_592560 [Morchella snyderi]|nr:hypothetical protein DFP73DRAFT_592560 [Morchella snyderi]